MSYIQRLWLIIVGKARHAIYLFLLVFLFALLGIVGYFFRNIVISYENTVIYDIGYSLMLYTEDNEAISQDVLEYISMLDGVVGYNQEYDMLVEPVNIHNAIEKDAANVFAIPDSEMLRLFGCTDTQLNLAFSNNMELIEGKMPATNCRGAIIDEVLAKENNLVVGDKIVIGAKQSELEIIGIYKTLSLPQETWKLPSGNLAYGQSPYSYVFFDIQSYEMIIGYELPLSSVYIYATDMDALENVYSAIIQMGLQEDVYRVSNLTENKLSNGTSAARAVNLTATLLTRLSSGLAITILFLVVLLWMRACYQDIAILISLGEGRLAIIIEYFILTTVIASVALLLALPCCYWLISNFSDLFVEYMFIATGNMSGLEMDNYMVVALEQELCVTDYIKSNLFLLVVVWVATLLSSIEIFRCKPTRLFHSS